MNKPTAEQRLLGSMILDIECISDVLAIVQPEDFSNPSNRLIFKALDYLYTFASPIDSVILRDELTQRGQLEQVGGVEYIMQLTGSVASAENAVRFAEIVAGIVVVGLD